MSRESQDFLKQNDLKGPFWLWVYFDPFRPFPSISLNISPLISSSPSLSRPWLIFLPSHFILHLIPSVFHGLSSTLLSFPPFISPFCDFPSLFLSIRCLPHPYPFRPSLPHFLALLAPWFICPKISLKFLTDLKNILQVIFFKFIMNNIDRNN